MVGVSSAASSSVAPWLGDTGKQEAPLKRILSLTKSSMESFFWLRRVHLMISETIQAKLQVSAC